MEELFETLYSVRSKSKDPNCESCKNKTSIGMNGFFWFSFWMIVMSIYGNVVFFTKIFKFIF